MKDHVDLPVSAQEREAYASDEYQKHLKSYADGYRARYQAIFLERGIPS